MKNITIPVFLLACVLSILAYTFSKQNESLTKSARAARQNESKLKKNQNEIEALAASNSEAQSKLAANKEFLQEWEGAYKRSVLNGMELRIQDGASLHDVTVPMPRTETPKQWGEVEGEAINYSPVHIVADGALTNLVRFLGEVERSLPLGTVQNLSIKPGDRQPKMELAVMVLNRSFVDMPEIPEDVVASAPAITSGVFAKRPDVRKFATPTFSENLIARSGTRTAVATQSKDTEITALVPTLKITGMIWDATTPGRRLTANGLILRPGQQIPSKLVKGKSKVVLTEIGPRFARFRIETEELNPVTAKMETTVVVRELEFDLFPTITPEG